MVAMQHFIKYSALCLLTVVSACGEPPSKDDPNNIPLHGQWTDESVSVTYRVNNMPSGDMDKFERFGPLNQVLHGGHGYCEEPDFRTNDSFRRYALGGNNADCTIETVKQRSTTKAIGKGKCSGFGDRTALISEVQLGPNEINYTVKVDVFQKDAATGAGRLETVEVQRKLKRQGDCQ
jgi:hypothetical protein